MVHMLTPGPLGIKFWRSGVAQSIFPEQLDKLLGKFQTTGIWNNNIYSFYNVKIIPAQRRTVF